MVRVKFYGGAEEVGNVRITLDYHGKTLCLDYGTSQEHGDPNSAFPKVDFVVVSHGHLDHVGNIPFSIKLNPSTKYIGTGMTKNLTEYQLRDSLKIDENNAKRGIPSKKPAGRRFKLDDIVSISDNWMPADYGTTTSAGDFEVKLVNAGHIPGSSITEVKCGDDRIVYTGDINIEGNLHGEFPDLDNVGKNPRALIIESTYGRENRGPRADAEKKFIDYVEDALSNGKNVFIPAFAIERIQKVGSLLSKIRGSHPDYEFYVISPSYLRMKTLAYGDLDLSNLTERERLPNDYRGKRSVVVSTSGFCTGGLSSKILRDVIDDRNYMIILPSGFIPDDSPLKSAMENGYAGFANANGSKTKKKVRADIKQVSLSAHSDRDGLIKIAEKVCPDKSSDIFLMHGEPDSQAILAQELRNRGYKVTIPKKYDEFNL